MTEENYTPATRALDVIEGILDEISEEPTPLTDKEQERYVALASRMMTMLGKVVETDVILHSMKSEEPPRFELYGGPEGRTGVFNSSMFVTGGSSHGRP